MDSSYPLAFVGKKLIAGYLHIAAPMQAVSISEIMHKKATRSTFSPIELGPGRMKKEEQIVPSIAKTSHSEVFLKDSPNLP
jgi:hypothetical protein